MRPLAGVPVLLLAWVIVPACENDPCAGTEHETADGACQPSSDTDMIADTDTDTSPDPKDAGTLTADATPSGRPGRRTNSWRR